MRCRALAILAALLLAACASHPKPAPHGAGWEDETDAGLIKTAAKQDACTDAPEAPPAGSAKGSTFVFDGMPPLRFRGNVIAEVQTHSADELNRICAPIPRPCATTYYACTYGRHIDLPNPCAARYAGERFALIACHEMGHVSGWPASHGE